MSAKYPGDRTVSLHGGQKPDPATGSRATPIYQTTSFVFGDQDTASSRFGMARSGHVYSRISNPTVSVLEERLSMLENGVGAVAVASGMAAIHIALVTLAGAGSHIVASKTLYGGTHNLLRYTLPRFGIETTFVDPRDPEAFVAASRPETVLGYVETLANPNCEVADIPRIASLLHEAHLPLFVDATITTPYLMKPLDLGADIVLHSLTKFIGGHGANLGGVIIDGGRFDWECSSSRFRTMCEPYDGFHDLNFSEEFGPSAFIVRARREGLRDFGPSLSPTSAFQLLQGVETLAVRMEKHTDSALEIANFLEQHKAVLRVNYPGLQSHVDYNLAKRLLPRGCGSVLSFEIQGGYAAGCKFVESLKLFSHLANVGDVKSLVIHPASTTHSRMTERELQEADIGPGLIRLSIGLEDTEDIAEDLDYALRKSQR